ncbi:hypothetical protein CEXT_538091 [Caerostris extrusa]|uniref:Uncharacterized protein n=1 Tax=Caerostris extrusa TaxID=172846 RepID=A0AAV4XKH4_CAEEX|nr:hypothetical protein CEXT_538091 [Caerostris extrusa]
MIKLRDLFGFTRRHETAREQRVGSYHFMQAVRRPRVCLCYLTIMVPVPRYNGLRNQEAATAASFSLWAFIASLSVRGCEYSCGTDLALALPPLAS